MNFSPAKHELLKKWLQGQAPYEIKNIQPRPLDNHLPLSFPQQRQLFLEVLEPGTAVNNLSVLLIIDGELDISALEKSANQIMARHDVLRTRFSIDHGLLTAEIPGELIVSIPIIDLPQSCITEQINEARRLAEKEVLVPFDLAQAPLIRLRIYKLNDTGNCLLVVVHHCIADGWSLGIFLRELMVLYQNNIMGKHIQLPDLPIQYPDFAYWQTKQTHEEELQSSLLYWKKQLSGELPVLELHTDQQRGSRRSFAGRTFRFELSKQLTEALEKISQQKDVTLFMTLLTAFYILLHRYSGQDDIVVGTPAANRTPPEVESLIGIFINTLALRINLADNPSFQELLRRVREVTLDAYAHQNLPFEKLVEELKPKRDLSRNPLFQALFNMQNSPMPQLLIPGLEINFLEIDRGVSQFDLTLMISKSAGQCEATVEYNDYLFTQATIVRMFQSYKILLEDAVNDPDKLVSGLQITRPEELHLFIYGLNQTRFNFSKEKCMHQLFELQAVKTPDAVAVIHENKSLSYSDLNRRANALARHLQSLGVNPEVRVGIFMEKSIEIVEALLSVHKAGGVYVPIHTSCPIERLQFILRDASVKVMLTSVDLEPLEMPDVHIVNLPDDTLSKQYEAANLQTNITSDNLAYIIYTSGSTGFPKGVMVPYSALVNFLCSMRDRPGIDKNDVLLSVTPVSFDIAALELFLPLTAGATVVLAGKEMTGNPLMMCQAIELHGVSIMQATPATWQLMVDSGWAGNRELKALCGGDVLTRNLANQLLKRTGSLWNMYGPTETTIWSAVAQVQKGNDAITIGRPVNNTQLYVLDRYLQPVPPGVVGELHIGGEGLARGYLNQPKLTNAKFIADNISGAPGARLYKTGDRACYLPDCSIELLGRMDDQVKINGHRVELGEITAVLMQHPSVHEAIAVTRKEMPGETRLVAYFTAAGDMAPDVSDLQNFIRKKLPGYMMPNAFVQLDRLPLTPNGKIDRNALPLPEDVNLTNGYAAPRNEDEELLASIWRYVLDLEKVGIYDNFFDLGGASIQSLQIVAKANMAGLRFSAEAIFEHQTIAELADHIRAKKK